MFGRRQNAAPDTFGTEVLGYLEPLYATAMRLTRNRADAEDLVQDTVVKALRFQSRFERGHEPAGVVVYDSSQHVAESGARHGPRGGGHR